LINLNGIKFSILKLNFQPFYSYALEMVYRKRWDVISGGFLAGDVATIRRFSVFFFKTFMALLDQV
jgi:hypothetical protein